MANDHVHPAFAPGLPVPAAHTPGPWTIEEDSPTSIWSGGHYLVETYDNGEANARLIAEAPNMLLLLKAAANMICDFRPADQQPYGIEKSIDALVARVEGRRS